MTDAQRDTDTGKAYDPSSMDEYLYTKEAGWFRQFLWFCAGADSQILFKCPHSDRVREEGIGGTVLATALLAFLSGSYAFYTVFEPKSGFALSELQQTIDWMTVVKALIFGVIWSAVIFNLDRFVISSTGHGDGNERISQSELVAALPRIILAAFIGFTLAKPLEIRIMKTEIEVELAQLQSDLESKRNKKDEGAYLERKTRFEEQVAEAQAKIDEREELLEKMRQEIQSQRDVVGKEAAGGPGSSGRPGEGKGYRAKKEILDKQEAEFVKAENKFEVERTQLDAVVQQAKAEMAKALGVYEADRAGNKVESRNLDGLIKRIEIAHEISPVSSWMLTMLLLLIEITPIFFKMMLIKGPYDYLVDNQREMVKAKYAIQDVVQLKPGSAAEVTTGERFHKPETVLEYQTGQLKVERSLTRVAQEAFERDRESDIQQHPEKYVREAKT